MMLFCFWESSRVFGPGGSFFLCGWGGMNGGRDEWREGRMEGGTNGQSASGAAAWSCLVRSFRRVILSV